MIESTETREAIRRDLEAAGYPEDGILGLLEAYTDDQAERYLAARDKAEADKAALRERLREDEALRLATCPPASWSTPENRYRVTAGAVRLIDATAEAKGLSSSALAAAIVEDTWTIAREIELHDGEDPSAVRWGTAYHGFRYAISRAVEVLTREERRLAAEKARAEQDAAWKRQGLTRCSRCGGAGGFAHWPGFDCYECGGRGAVRKG